MKRKQATIAWAVRRAQVNTKYGRGQTKSGDADRSTESILLLLVFATFSGQVRAIISWNVPIF